MKRTIAALKSIFSTGKRPSQADYGDWLDSYVHLDNQAAVDGQVVDTKINAYNNSLTVRNQNGKIDTLGDVYGYMDGLPDSLGGLKVLLDKISWPVLPNRPAQLALSWTEQVIVTDTSAFDPQPRNPALPQTVNTNPARWWGFSIAGFTAGAYLVSDIRVERQWYSIPQSGGNPITFYTDQIVSIKYAVSPKANT